jgi:superfamily II DNA helicase RecQ
MQYRTDAQIIIYCPTKQETKQLAVLLECTAYYQTVATDEEKTRIVQRFTSGMEKMCTATNMLGLGLDAPSVRVVIHVVMCCLLLEFMQESGWARRIGLESEAIVLREC